MHVGWVAAFEPPQDGPAPSFEELFTHMTRRLALAPRYRQRLAGVPLGLHEPVWVDDRAYDPAEHLLRGDGDGDLGSLVDRVLSSPLPRDRPLWQMWFAGDQPGGGFAIVGKMHHCMVDGTAVVELGNVDRK